MNARVEVNSPFHMNQNARVELTLSSLSLMNAIARVELNSPFLEKQEHENTCTRVERIVTSP